MPKYTMSLSQTTLFNDDSDTLIGTIRELATNSQVRDFIKEVITNYTPPKPYLLLIPESRQKPFTKSRLCKKVKDFLGKHRIDVKYHVVFISNVLGVCPEEFSHKEAANFELIGGFPSKSVIERTAEIIARYLSHTRAHYKKLVVYARGSYLESVKIAGDISGVKIESILTGDELYRLKRLGIRWMKIGLRMEEAFSIFRQKIIELTNNGYVQTKLSE